MEDSAYHLLSGLECPSSDVLVIVLCYLLVVGYSLETSLVSKFINGVKIVVKLLLVGILVELLVPKGLDPYFNKYDSF